MKLGNETNKKFIGRSVFVASVNNYGMPNDALGLVGKILGIEDRTKYHVILPGHARHPRHQWHVHPNDLRLLGTVLNQ